MTAQMTEQPTNPMPKRDEMEINAKTELLPAERYLKTGSHIGTRYKSGDMNKYVYKQRSDGLKVMDISVIDARLKLAASMLSQYNGNQIVVVARKLYGQTSAKSFASAIGGKALVGRFIPGSFTNPSIKTFLEPKIVVVAEPESDSQAIQEASLVGIPIIALCSTNNSTANVDLVVPINNKGRKSLALAFWLLTREYLKARGEISGDAAFTTPIEEFEYQVPESENVLEDGSNGERRPFRRGPPMGGPRGEGRRDSRDRDDRPPRRR